MNPLLLWNCIKSHCSSKLKHLDHYTALSNIFIEPNIISRNKKCTFYSVTDPLDVLVITSSSALPASACSKLAYMPWRGQICLRTCWSHKKIQAGGKTLYGEKQGEEIAISAALTGFIRYVRKHNDINTAPGSVLLAIYKPLENEQQRSLNLSAWKWLHAKNGSFVFWVR